MSVTKRLVDVDDDKLEQVRALLGTSTTKATVNGALEEVLALDARRQALIDEAVAGSADLAQSDQRRAAWA
jgi:Arc/MetJ family transcription regulator